MEGLLSTASLSTYDADQVGMQSCRNVNDYGDSYHTQAR